MYADAADRHERIVKVRLTDDELDLLRRAAQARRLQPAAAARVFVLERMVKKFCSADDLKRIETLTQGVSA